MIISAKIVGENERVRNVLSELVGSVNAFMESCEAKEIKIPFIPCEVLMWDLKQKVKDAEKALKGDNNE